MKSGKGVTKRNSGNCWPWKCLISVNLNVCTSFRKNLCLMQHFLIPSKIRKRLKSRLDAFDIGDILFFTIYLD